MQAAVYHHCAELKIAEQRCRVQECDATKAEKADEAGNINVYILHDPDRKIPDHFFDTNYRILWHRPLRRKHFIIQVIWRLPAATKSYNNSTVKI